MASAFASSSQGAGVDPVADLPGLLLGEPVILLGGHDEEIVGAGHGPVEQAAGRVAGDEHGVGVSPPASRPSRVVRSSPPLISSGSSPWQARHFWASSGLTRTANSHSPFAASTADVAAGTAPMVPSNSTARAERDDPRSWGKGYSIMRDWLAVTVARRSGSRERRCPTTGEGRSGRGFLSVGETYLPLFTVHTRCAEERLSPQ